MVSQSAVATATQPRTVRFPSGASALPEVFRWLVEVVEETEDDRAPGPLTIAMSGAAGEVGPETVAECTRWEKALVRLERLPVPLVGLVDGAVTGSAFQLLLALDLVVASPATVLSCRDLDHGRLAGMALFRLAKYTGMGHAKRLVFAGDALPAAEALRLGLITAVSLDPETTGHDLLERRFHRATPAWYLSRRMLAESYAESFEDALGNMLAAQERVLRHRTEVEPAVSRPS
jgi:isomerase DpgB